MVRDGWAWVALALFALASPACDAFSDRDDRSRDIAPECGGCSNVPGPCFCGEPPTVVGTGGAPMECGGCSLEPGPCSCGPGPIPLPDGAPLDAGTSALVPTIDVVNATDGGAVDLATACVSPGRSLTPCSDRDYRVLLVGRWWQCSGSWFGDDGAFPPGVVGAEFDESGSWFALSSSPEGTLVRSTALQGTWDLLDAQDALGPCSVQLDIERGSGFTPATMAFTDEPRALLLGAAGAGAMPHLVAVP